MFLFCLFHGEREREREQTVVENKQEKRKKEKDLREREVFPSSSTVRSTIVRDAFESTYICIHRRLSSMCGERKKGNRVLFEANMQILDAYVGLR